MRIAVGLSVLMLFGASMQAQVIHGRAGITLPAPPAVDKQPVVDNYFGTKITDDYRWLENAKSPETKAYIDAENAYTAEYFAQARIRPKVVDELEQLEAVTTWSLPVERAGNLYFMKRLAEEGQASIYMRKGWAGRDERLIDPAALSRNPNASVTLDAVSRDGNLIAYGVREGGSDSTVIRVYNVKEHKTLEDALPSGLYFGEAFSPDESGFYYTRDNRAGTLMYLHTLGTRNFEDKLVFGHSFYDEPLGTNDLFFGNITDDDRYLVVTIERGVPARRVDIVFRDLRKPDSPFKVLVWGMDARFRAVWAKDAWYVRTDYDAPLGRIVKMEPGFAPQAWQTLVPEGKDVIDGFSMVGGKMYVKRLKDVKSETEVYSLEGKPEGTIAYDGIGSASNLFGRTTDRYGYFSFQSYIEPPTLYRLDTVTGKREVFAQPKVPFNTSDYELKQVFYTSKDGTRVPMFIAGRKGLKQDGTVRLLMTGYGGFNLSMTPTWNTQWAWWMEQGGWFALPNLRGGGEYGEKWHEAAMFGKKQNVFDDLFAAAEYLIKNKYTSAEHFAITGRSNGGLLMGAAMTERPDLFAAIVCGYPLLDMLRYQKFEQGSHWMTEYGSADDEKQFEYLVKYSPYQNVKAGTRYPAILFFTGSSDTRVDPLHARKMTAEMQAASTSGRPILLHYSLAGGHSAGVSVEQKVQDDADQLTFLWTESGPETKGPGTKK
ncbi:MAG: prolyl oligopeptidase family serine peptidase [Terracidiphilus sp.]